MTMEMGESLIHSWMKHVLGCHIVQTNLKASTRWTKNDIEKVCEIVDVACKYKILMRGKVRSTDALTDRILRQFECDCVGVKFENGGYSITVAEVAFHEDGLHYTPRKGIAISDPAEYTAYKIFAKLVSAAIALYTYFGVKEGRLCFATPKTIPSFRIAIKKREKKFLRMWKEIKEKYGVNYQFDFISDERFENEILRKVRRARNNVADMSELFMRSLQLEHMFDRNSDSKYFEERVDADESDITLLQAHKSNLKKVLGVLKITKKKLRTEVFISPSKVYDKCKMLSRKDKHGNLCMALREEYRVFLDKDERPTLWDIRRMINKNED